MEHRLSRIGLSRAALEAAILADLEESDGMADAKVVASAIADAMDANNEEILRQLREMLAAEVAELLARRGI
jgi:GTP-sensing pleiotropic transcriptional regulator CodY